MKSEICRSKDGFSAQYIEEAGKHKWIVNPTYYNGEPILSIKPIKGLCKYKNVLVCPLYGTGVIKNYGK